MITVDETVTAMLPGEQNVVSIVRASKGSPDEYLQRIAAAIDSGVGHRDLRNLSGEVASTAKLWSKDMQVRAGWINSLLRQGISRRFALAIAPDPHRYGLGRMLSSYLEKHGVDRGAWGSSATGKLRWAG